MKPDVMTLVWIAVGVLGVVAIAAVPALIFRSMAASLEERIQRAVVTRDLIRKDLRANSFGLESAGVWQVRGNGALVLTKKTLHFFMFAPGRDFRVPLDAIREVTLTKHHLMKATIYDLVKVRFVVDHKEDSIAWYVPEPKIWKDRIERQLHEAVKG